MGAYGLMSQPLRFSLVSRPTHRTMCEIAVLPNNFGFETDEESALETYTGAIEALAKQNRDGAGIVAVHDEGSHFEYDTFKRSEPEFGEEMESFLLSNRGAWRFVLHARAATHGTVSYPNTHPISTGACDECDFDYVVHNGVVSGEQEHRERLSDDGHEFTTKVDSEVIAHEIGSTPDELSEFEASDLGGSLNYFLFASDGILVRTESKYRVTPNFTVACTRRNWLDADDRAEVPDDGDESTFRKGWVLVTPGPDIDFKHRQTQTVTARSAGSSSGVAGWPFASRMAQLATRWSGVGSDDGDEAEQTDAVADADHFRESVNDDDWQPDMEDTVIVSARSHRVHADPLTATRVPNPGYRKGQGEDYEWCAEHAAYHLGLCPACRKDADAVPQEYGRHQTTGQ
jgi:hypothetical protein